jgi:alpha-maltose-1-phosphate synthase
LRLVKALVLTREYPPHVYGGAGVVVDQLTRALGRRMAVEVRCFGDPRAAAPAIAVRGYAPWERLAAGPDGPRFAPALEALSVGLAMARDPVDADVAHAHTWYASMAGLLVKTLHGIPLVVTLHSLEPLRPWKADQLGRGYLVSSGVERRAIESADRVIAVSEAMRADALRYFTVDPSRVAVVHNGIDPEVYRRTAERGALGRLGIREPYVLFVGRISEQKGLFDLVEASTALPAGVTVVLCAATPDTPELEARLAGALAGNPAIRWVREMLAVPDVVQLYSHAALFVCPSVYEPFGLINLEAMACETAVVATAVGGIVEVVEDGRTGLLVPPSRPAELAAAMRALLGDPDRARAMGAAGRRRVEERFTWDRVAERTERVYAEAIEVTDFRRRH